ncbi:MAG: hypothetical protein AAF539_11190 [Planctomycetota bacterium]
MSLTLRYLIVLLTIPAILQTRGQQLLADGVIQIDLVADGDSRWYQWDAEVFAQLNRGRNGDPSLDGFYFTADTDADEFINGVRMVPMGGGDGTADVFPFEEDFSNIGNIVFDGENGSSGTFDIQEINLDFHPYVNDDDSTLGTRAYSTTATNVSGSVTLDDGVVTSFNQVSADIAFTYDITGLPDFVFAETNALEFDGLDFQLSLRDTAFNGAFDFEWDVFGTASGVSAIPEPSSFTLALIIVAAVFRTRRRQATTR